MAQEGLAVSGEGPDEVTITIKRGVLKLRVPGTVPDNRVISKEYMDQFMQAVLELEDGSELTIVLDSATDLADTRLIPASERVLESEG
jgi:hypothetical protein